MLHNLLPRGGFGRSVVTLTSGAGAAQLVTILAVPALTRLYAPEDFGFMASFAGILAILAVIGSMRLEMAVPLPESDDDALSVLVLTLVVSAVIALLISIVAAVWGSGLLRALGASGLVPYRWLFPIAVAAAGAYNGLSNWAIRKRSYGDVAWSRLTQAATSTGAQLIFGALRAGVIGLLIGQVLFQAAGILRLGRLFWRQSRGLVRRRSVRVLLTTATRYANLALLSTGSAVLNTASTRIPPIVIVAMFGPVIGGFYYLTQRVIGLPATLIGQAVQKTYFGEFSFVVREQPDRAVALFWRVVRIQAFIAIPTMTAIALLAPSLFSLVFGSDWREAGIYVMILAPMFVLRFVSAPVGVTLLVIERQELYLYREIVRSLLIVAAFTYAYFMQLEALGAIVCIAIAGSIGYVVHFMTSWIALRQHMRSRTS